MGNVQLSTQQIFDQFIVPELNEAARTGSAWLCRDTMKHTTFNIMYAGIFGGEYLSRDDASYIAYTNAFESLIKSFLPHIFGFFVLGPRLNALLIPNRADPLYQTQLDVVAEWARRAHGRYDDVDEQPTFFGECFRTLSLSQQSEDFDSVMTREVLSDFEIAMEGGTDTTASTLEYCIAVAAKYEALQEELCSEIAENIGDTLDVLQNMSKLHKLKAFVREALRMCPAVATSVMRSVNAGAEKGGVMVEVEGEGQFWLPNGTAVTGNIIGMQRDPTRWESPDEFRIERWLNEKGQFSTKRQSTMIANFSFGRRNCPGQALALKSMYVLLAMLFRKYRFYYENPEEVQIKFGMDFVMHVEPQIGCRVALR